MPGYIIYFKQGIKTTYKKYFVLHTSANVFLCTVDAGHSQNLKHSSTFDIFIIAFAHRPTSFVISAYRIV